MSSGLVDRLLSEVTTGDGLTQLTALQLLTPLAMSPGGRALLDEKGVTARLMYLLSLAQSDPIARLLTHGGCLYLVAYYGRGAHACAVLSLYLAVSKFSFKVMYRLRTPPLLCPVHSTCLSPCGENLFF